METTTARAPPLSLCPSFHAASIRNALLPLKSLISFPVKRNSVKSLELNKRYGTFSTRTKVVRCDASSNVRVCHKLKPKVAVMADHLYIEIMFNKSFLSDEFGRFDRLRSKNLQTWHGKELYLLKMWRKRTSIR
ncbi:hypothetical protein OIU85_028051 [Salix viminalis]|uniref:Uncharacterized protein n=1 Tax=Salix viminalis TaxID=40686 RepID=A0A9Q0QJA0_SALVM|nr:hypothetical protein OIU85_028051 [Salix viminalis]